jgi:hypothetical protein
VISWVTLPSIKYYLPEISFIPLTHFRFPHITMQFLHWGESRVLIILERDLIGDPMGLTC